MGDQVDQIIQNAISKLDQKIPSVVKKEIASVVEKIVKEKQPVNEAIGITKEQEDTIYNQAYKLFKTGKYKQARGLFHFLSLIQPNSPIYTFSIAVCSQKLKDFSDAAAHYMITSQLDPFNPQPQFQLYYCLMQLNSPLAALNALAMTIECAKLNPVYAPLLERAKLEFDNLVKVLDQKNEEENKQKSNKKSNP